MNDVDPEVQRIVDGLLAELGIVDLEAAAPAPVPVKADRAEVPRRSWMDQVGRARKSG